jgi:glycosyltransferase involved in cell wall biosynthesis
MVQLLLEELRKDPAFEVFHVNARLSSSTADIGAMRFGKLLPLLRYCAQAISLRFRHDVRVFYYVPANPSRAALLRDWVVMLCCRPFFPKRVFHWHAAGLARWIEEEIPPFQRRISHTLLSHATLSVVLSHYNRVDAELLRSDRIEIVPNGIPDPCPRFDEDVLPARRARLAQRAGATGSSHFRVLYIGLCLRDKGLFDAVEAVHQANKVGAVRFTLSVAGTFWHAAERAEFEQLCGQLNAGGTSQVEYLGFVSGEEKQRLFRESDCLLFPTYYSAESFGLVLIEAMAYGLPVITTNWRMIPEVLPHHYPGLVAPRAAEQIAARLRDALTWNSFEKLRKHYLANFTAEEFWSKMKAALLLV